MASLRRFALSSIAVALLSLPFYVPAVGCPFCGGDSSTMLKEADLASLILYGKLTNAKLDPKDPNGAGTTDLVIDTVVKTHEILGDKKVVTLPKYIPLEKDQDIKYLIFCDVYKGKIDPYRGVPAKADSRIAGYLKGALAVKEKPAVERLKFFFDYLDDADGEVSSDAYKEFGNADYKDVRGLAEKLPADKIAGWLKDPNTLTIRLGLYGSLLGHCGKPEQAKLLRGMIDDPDHKLTTGIDGMLAGYVMLAPKEGWDYVAAMLADSKREFMQRYAALRAVRFFHEYRPDVVSKDKVVAALLPTLSQKDIADLVVEDFRKWGSWEQAERVLDLYGKPGFSEPIVKRAVMRFALTCPPEKSKRAAEFVAERRKENAKYVEEIEELLSYENPKPAPAAQPTAKSTAPK